MRSSYKINNYGYFFKSISKIHNPELIVELGVLDGYSLISLASGAPNSKTIGIDLFEDYEFNHGDKDKIYKKIYREGLNNVNLIKKDAYEAYKDFENNSIDILHIDISNDGSSLEKLCLKWFNKIKKNGLIICEGGSKERDEIDWMLKYNKSKIENFKNDFLDYNYKNKTIEFITLTPFPSITLIRKKI